MTQRKPSRREFLYLSGMATAYLGLPKQLLKNTSVSNTEQIVYVGTYTSGKSEGIYIYRLNTTTGELRHQSTLKDISNPSFLTIDQQQHFLFAVNEDDQYAGKPTGSVSALAIDQNTGDLKFLNREATLGTSPCHLAVDKSNRFVLTANYGTGSVSVMTFSSAGRLSPVRQLIQHHGSSVNKDRQTGPHAHCVALDNSNQHVFVADLGIDKVMVYRFDSSKGTLTPNTAPSVNLNPGDGPRHLALHPKEKFAYVINELANTITAFSFQKSDASFKQLQSVSTLPPNFTGDSATAEIVVSPSGRFLYGSNRGHDSIAVFSIDQGTGFLTPVEFVSTLGKKPRNFAIDRTGSLLLVANQDSDNIVMFKIDPDTGKLSAIGPIIDVPTPVCVLFAKLK